MKKLFALVLATTLAFAPLASAQTGLAPAGTILGNSTAAPAQPKYSTFSSYVNNLCTLSPSTCGLIFGYKNILWYGGDSTGTNDNGVACVAALASFNIHTGGRLVFPAGQYKFSTSCVIPSFTANGATGETPIVRFEMSGATLFPATNNMKMLDRFPVNQTEAQNSVSARYEIIGGDFNGLDPNTGAQLATGVTAIRLGASYGSYINGTLMQFGFDTGLDLQFALNAKVTNVRCSGSASYCVIAREGQWTGATTNNSQSNDTLFENVRDSAANAQIATFYIHATDGVIIRNSICEGGNESSCVLFDDDRNTTVKSLNINGLHIEGTNLPIVGAIITMKGAGGGVYTIQNVFNQTIGTLLDVSAFDGSGQTFNILDTDYTGAFGTAFKVQVSDANKWNFRGWFGNIRAAGLWSGGNIPDDLNQLNGGTITAKKLIVGDSVATNSAAFGLALYGPAYPQASDTYSLGFSILRWTGLYLGTTGLDSTGPLITTNATASTSTGTGAVVVTGGAGFGGQVNAPTTRTTPVLVGSLPTCNSGNKGARSFVTDATATTFASIVAGTGANNMPVVCNGTNWIIG